MKKKLVIRRSLTKGLFILGGFILATNLTYSAPIADSVGVEFTIHDNLIINTSTTNLDFGNVPLSKTTVTAPTNAMLTIEGNDMQAASVRVTVPKEIVLNQGQGGSTIPFTSTLTGTDGSTKEEGADLVWTSTSGFTPGQKKFDVEFGGTIVLSGTETTGDYNEIATINVAYN